MPTLELTDQQVVHLVRQLPPGRQRSLLRELKPDPFPRERRPLGGDEEALEPRFQALVREWKEATQFMSSITAIVTHPAYQQIIGLGRAAVPLILAELRRDADHWFWALQAITSENPVSPADRGNVPAMTRAWLEWAEGHGY